MEDTFSLISGIIKNRRSTKPVQLNGNIIPDEQIEQLLELADWAPTHGNTEPWRFTVYTGNGMKEFCLGHAELYKRSTNPESFLKTNYEKILHNGDKASHIILSVMQRGRSPKISAMEEEAAVSSAIQNILLGATALNIASFWSTGGMAHHPAFKEYLQLREEDVVMGILFLGYTDITATGKRIIPLTEKVKWVK